MKERFRLQVCLFLILLSSHPYDAAASAAREVSARAVTQERPKSPARRGATPPRKIAKVPRQISGTSEKISKVATENFKKRAQREALSTTTPPQELRSVPEPEEEDEPRKKTVPPDAVFFRDESGAPSTHQALGPSPTTSASFQGSRATDSAPPDTQGAVGLNHLVVAVNGGVLIQSKAGSVLSFRSLVNFFAVTGSTDVFDPRVQYDPFNNRWILIAVANHTSAASAIVLGASQTSDPTGNWHFYMIDADPADQVWADFPMLGFNKDWIVVSTNSVPITGSSSPPSAHARFYILGKANVYAGATTNLTRRAALPENGFNIVPASTYDPSLSTLYLLQNFNGNSGGSGHLRLYTITGAIGSEVLDNTTSNLFISVPNPWNDFPPGRADFAPQSGTFDKIHVNDAAIQNLVYRNGSLWCAQSIFLPAGGPTRSSIQWWQINPVGATIQQRGRIDDPSGNFFYGFPSIAVNRNNDVLIVLSLFNSQFAGRVRVPRAPITEHAPR